MEKIHGVTVRTARVSRLPGPCDAGYVTSESCAVMIRVYLAKTGGQRDTDEAGAEA